MNFTERHFLVLIHVNGEIDKLETSVTSWWLDRPRKRSLKEEIITCAKIEHDYDIPVKTEDCEVYEIVKIEIN